MSDDDDRRPVAIDASKLVQNTSGVDRVEVSGRLVGKDQFRVPGDRPGDRDALTLPARQRRGALERAFREPDRVDGAEDTLTPLDTRHAPVEQVQLDAVDGWSGLEKMEGLEHESDRPCPHARRTAAVAGTSLLAVENIAARRRVVEETQNVHQCRLATARWPDDRNELPLVDLQVDTAQCIDIGPTCRRVRPTHSP